MLGQSIAGTVVVHNNSAVAIGYVKRMMAHSYSSLAGYTVNSTNARKDAEGHTRDLIHSHEHRHTDAPLLQIKDKEPKPMDNVRAKKKIYSVLSILISVSTYRRIRFRFDTSVFPFLYNRSLGTLKLWACVYK